MTDDDIRAWQSAPASVLIATPEAGVTAGEACQTGLPPTETTGENVLVVSYTRTADEVLTDWRARAGWGPAAMGVVSVGERTRTAATRPTPAASRADRPLLTTVAQPDDLTGLGTTVGMYLDEWAATDARIVVCFDSLTALLSHVETRTAFRFVHALTARLAEAGAVAHFHLDPSAHAAETVRTLEPLFDRVIEGSAPADQNPEHTVSDVEEIATLLAQPRRRHVVRVLADGRGPVEFEALAAEVTAREHRGESAPHGAHERVRTTLHHAHLPRLAAGGVIGYGGRGGEVALAVSTDRAREYLAATSPDE